MPHLDCVPVAVPAVHPTPQFELGYETGLRTSLRTDAQKQQLQVQEEQKSTNREPKKKTTKGMCQTPVTEDSLSQFQLDKLAELKAQLGEQLLQETPIFNDNFSLLRWLYGWNYRIEEIVPRFKKASSVFRCMRVNGMLIEDVDELNEFTRTLTLAAEHFPGGVLGHDREGNVVVMQAMGKSHPKQLSKCGRVSDVYRLSIVETALVYQLIRLQERKHRRKLGLRVIIDLEGFSSDHLTTFGLKVYGALLKNMQDMFPDLLRQVYVINAHYLVKTAYTIIKPVLSEQSREKVVFLDHAFHAQLANDIGPENLFPHWGGTRSPPRGHSLWGTLRMGGIPPNSMKYCPTKNPNHITDDHLQRLSVPARQRKEVEVRVPETGAHLLQWFWTSSSDIDFGVLTEQDQEIWPMFRLLTDHVPEHGSMRVESGRIYKLVFDNSFSVFTKKEVKLGYRLSEVEEANVEDHAEPTKLEEEKENEVSMKSTD